MRICILGAGVMGSAIAALVANASCEVLLLDIASLDSKDKNHLLKQALEKMQVQKPSPLSHINNIERIKIGNLEDDLYLISQCDIIIEAIVENIEAKRQLYNRIIPYLKDDAILASNTSTIPLKELIEHLPTKLKSRFLIIHFFNPPRYMELVELVTQGVDSVVIKKISNFIENDLGKTIIKCNDSPGFIANRVGCFLLETVVRKTLDLGLSLVVIDHIFNKLFGFPETGIFGLYDLIGHDVMQLISSSLTEKLPPEDKYQEIYLRNLVLEKMLNLKMIGRKVNRGFYHISNEGGNKTIWVISTQQLLNTEKIKENIDSLYLPLENNFKESFKSVEELLGSSTPYGNLFEEIFTEFYAYVLSLIPSVTDNIYDIDIAMKLGYSWKYGPFELLYNHFPNGFEWLIKRFELKNIEIPPFIEKKQYLNINKRNFESNNLSFDREQAIISNNSASLFNYQGSLIFNITTKANCLNIEVFNSLLQAIDYAEYQQKNLYIYNQLPNFSAGADLKLIATYIEEGKFDNIEEFLKLGQSVMKRLKYAKINIISCPFGSALGGGCELLLHSDFIVAHTNSNVGLVEMSVGLIPAWGGIKETFSRAKGNADYLRRNLGHIITQHKSASAEYFATDYELTNIKVVMNRSQILDEAIRINVNDKVLLPDSAISMPDIDLFSVLETEKYNKFQLEILSFFQEIIALERVNEEELFELERRKFLELCRNPQTIDSIRSRISK